MTNLPKGLILGYLLRFPKKDTISFHHKLRKLQLRKILLQTKLEHLCKKDQKGLDRN
jgi:hypothetical protein